MAVHSTFAHLVPVAGLLLLRRGDRRIWQTWRAKAVWPLAKQMYDSLPVCVRFLHRDLCNRWPPNDPSSVTGFSHSEAASPCMDRTTFTKADEHPFLFGLAQAT